MNINDITNFIKVADISINKTSSKKMLMCDYCIDKSILLDNTSRIYIFTSNSVIKKIGGSSSKGGIKSTLSFYESANLGKPSICRFGIQLFILDEIKKGNIVEVYMMLIKPVFVEVNGLCGIKKKKVNLSFKETEAFCLSEYFNKMKKYPDWNLQELGEKWPTYIQKEYIKHRTERI